MAVNEVRQPLGRSLHDVVGELSQVMKHPCVPLPDLHPAGLGLAGYERILDAARRLSKAWAPVERGDDFLWRDLAKSRISQSDETDYRHRVSQLREALNDLKDACTAVHEDLRISGVPGPRDAPRLQELLRLVETRPLIDHRWLMADDLTAANDRIERLAERAERLTEIERDLAARSARWRDLDPESAPRLEQGLTDLSSFDPSPGPLEARTAKELQALRAALDETATMIREAEWRAKPLADAFGADGDLSVEMLDRLTELGALTETNTPPDPEWFGDQGLLRARKAHAALAALVPPCQVLHDDLTAIFVIEVLDLDLDGLRARFREQHKGLRKLARRYREDKRTLAAATVVGTATKEALGRLDDLVAWQEADRQLAAAEEAHAEALGAYYPDRASVDFERASAAMEVAERAVGVSGGLVARDSLADALGGSVGSPHVRAAAAGTAEILEKLRSCELASLATSAMAALEHMELRAAVRWCTELSAALGAVAEEVGQVEQAEGAAVPVSTAGETLRRRAEFVRREADVAEAAESVRDIAGKLASVPDAQSLRDASIWVQRVRGNLAAVDHPVHPRTAASLMASPLTETQVSEPVKRAREALDHLLGVFKPAQSRKLRADLDHSFDTAFELLDALGASAGDMRVWSEFVQARRALIDGGATPVVVECERSPSVAEHVPLIVKHSILRRWADCIVDDDARLQPGAATDRDALRERFRKLDRKLVKNATAAVINACAERWPPSLVGGAGIINREAEKKTRHLPVRALLSRAGDAAQRIKPCFMMSPLSVSQFLPPDLSFDVVIFDEASQVKEADAVNCICRGEQLIVAGDQKQLPPTSFFDRMANADDEDIDDEIDRGVDSFESVLDRCKAQGFRSLPLRWHYRSRHESLINYSNHSFYEGRLHTFPGPVFDSPDLGVEIFCVDGTYRRGTTRDNPAEADKVVDRVLFHRRCHPDATLGVVALSTAQQAAVETEIERRSENEPELRDLLVTDDRLSGFFVKNLESVQGDERDIIILTVGYGPDENRKLTMNFGPLNRQGGERRLNVAVTRARCRVEVVASVRAGDITSTNEAISHFQRYLDYAERGPAALAIDLRDSLGDAESPFEEEVLASLRSMGHEAVPQVGVAGYRIDIGVRHPHQSGSYLLGVECDGASYHSSKAARDRDRLRQEVLESLGWTIHRIWSTAWLTDRSGAERRLREAIVRALDGPPEPTPRPGRATSRTRTLLRPAHGDHGKAKPDDSPHVQVDEPDFDTMPEWAQPYVEPRAPSGPPQRAEFHDPESRHLIARQIREIVDTHTPIHHEDVLRAVRDEWGLKRSGQRVRDAFARAATELCRSGVIERRGDWLYSSRRDTVVRVPPSDGLPGRGIREVPPEEIELAICHLLRGAGPTNVADLREAWARLYGWRRVGAEIEIAFENAVDGLAAAGKVIGPDPLRLKD